MSRCGVFLLFTLIFLVIFPQTALSSQVTGGFSGSLDTGGYSYKTTLRFEQRGQNYSLQLGLTGEIQTHGSEGTLNYRIQLGEPKLIYLDITGNHPHYTSADAFRLIHKDNFSEQSQVLSLATENLQGAILKMVPYKNWGIVDAAFWQSSFFLGPLVLRGSQLEIDNVQKTQIIQLEGGFSKWSFLGALGWQLNYGEGINKATIVELSRTKDKWGGRFNWQYVEPNFTSSLAKTNKYTPNRLGLEMEITSLLAGMEVGLTYRNQTNLEGTKLYRRYLWTIKGKDHPVSAQLRLEPTKAFILLFQSPKHKAQLDLWNGVIHYDWNGATFGYNLRFDLERAISRFEFRLSGLWQMRLVAKYDFLKARSNHSLSFSYSTKRATIKLGIGYYDQGNLLAGFNRSSGASISWEWKF